jgi:RNA polymerase sigma-70 factor (family 1)
MLSYQLLEDDALVALLKKGDDGAFTEIYNRYLNKLLAIAYNHTKDKSDAEEIVQDVFISLWNRKHVLEIQSLKNYLATATKFTVFTIYYKPIKKKEKLLQKLNVVSFQSDEEKIDAKFLHEYIHGFVEQLPEKCRTVFKYSRESELSIPEIAEKMNIAEKTAEAHLTKALKTLRLSLKHIVSIIILVPPVVFFLM